MFNAARRMLASRVCNWQLCVARAHGVHVAPHWSHAKCMHIQTRPAPQRLVTTESRFQPLSPPAYLTSCSFAVRGCLLLLSLLKPQSFLQVFPPHATFGTQLGARAALDTWQPLPLGSRASTHRLIGVGGLCPRCQKQESGHKFVVAQICARHSIF